MHAGMAAVSHRRRCHPRGRRTRLRRASGFWYDNAAGRAGRTRGVTPRRGHAGMRTFRMAALAALVWSLAGPHPSTTPARAQDLRKAFERAARDELREAFD